MVGKSFSTVCVFRGQVRSRGNNAILLPFLHAWFYVRYRHNKLFGGCALPCLQWWRRLVLLSYSQVTRPEAIGREDYITNGSVYSAVVRGMNLALR